MTAVTSEQRHTRRNPCPVCGGFDTMPRGKGKRCHGYTSDDEKWAWCAQVESDHQTGDLWRHRMRDDPRPDTLTAYDYFTEDGVLAYQVVRFPPKDFRQRRPDGAGGWIWKMAGVERLPYRLPELAASAGVVYVVEGEKDVDTARRLGLTATCNPGGAGKWSAIAGVVAPILKGRAVVIIQDKDAAGRKHAAEVKAHLANVAASVLVVEVPGSAKDLSEWAETEPGLTATDVAALPPVTLSVAPGPTAEDAPPPGRSSTLLKEPWRRDPRFIFNQKGTPKEHLKPCLVNACLVLELSERYKDLCWNELKDRIDAHPGEAWTDEHTSEFRRYLEETQNHFCLTLPREIANDAIAFVASHRRFHPVRTWLESLTWDGKPRIHRLFLDYFGGDSSGEGAIPYLEAVSRRWMIGAVARVVTPGCQLDEVVILHGKERLYKSTGIKLLVGGEDWFDEGPVNFDNYQKACEAIRGVWVRELSELAGMRGAKLEVVTSFVTTKADSYRRPYARHVTTAKRQTVLVGTTNESAFLAQFEEGRRWVPIHVLRPSDMAAIARDRDELWAEAYARHKAGEAWHQDTDELRDASFKARSQVREQDPWMGQIDAWLNFPGRNLKDGVTTTECLRDCLRVDFSKMGNRESQRVASIFRALGMSRVRQQVDGVREWRFVREEAQNGDLP